jgi:hypothetical protein
MYPLNLTCKPQICFSFVQKSMCGHAEECLNWMWTLSFIICYQGGQCFFKSMKSVIDFTITAMLNTENWQLFLWRFIFLFLLSHITHISVDSKQNISAQDNKQCGSLRQTFCVDSRAEVITPLLPMQSKLYQTPPFVISEIT